MKQSNLWAIILIAALAACGGGGSGGGGPMPGGGPGPTTYTAKIVFVGALAGHQIQAALRRSDVSIMDASSNVPIMVVSPISATGPFSDTSAYGGTVEVVVSPAPAPTTYAVAVTNTNPDASVSPTPSPQPSQTPMPLPTGVVAAQSVTTNGTVNGQSAGTVTASVPDLSASSSTPIYAYAAISMDCQYPISQTYSPGWQWNGTSWVAVSDPSVADIYISGPQCPGLYDIPTSDGYGQLNVPNGAINYSDNTPFSSLAAGQFAATYTSFDMETLDQVQPDGSQNTEILGRTRSGAIFKLFPNSYGPFPGSYSGAVEVSGVSVDGF